MAVPFFKLQCLPHSWYLAVDMQLFIVSPFIMWLVWKKPKLGLAVVGLLILLSMSASFLITWFYELAASMFGHAGYVSNIRYISNT